MQRSALILFAVAILAALTCLWWPAGEPPAPPGPVATGLPGPVASVTPKATRPPPDVLADTPRVRVEVTSLERFVAPPPPRLAAATADGHELPVELLAGVGAGFDAERNGAGVAMAKVALAGHCLLRQAVFEVEGPARLWLGARLQVGGHVRDEHGKAIAGCAVWFGELDADGNRCEFLTDDEGHYDGDAPAGGGVPFVVSQPGMALSWRVVEIAAPVPPMDAVLRRGTGLEVQLAATAFDADNARAYVVPIGSVSSDVAQYPFFAQGLSDGFAFDRGGHAVIEQLPVDGELGIVVRHPRVFATAPQRVVLKEERLRVLVPVQLLAGSWRGRLVDEAGNAVVGASLWSRTPDRSLAPGGSPRLLPPHLGALGTCFARSDASGEFELGAIDAVDALLTMRAPGRAGRDVPWRSLTPGTAIVLPAYGGGEAEFVLSPPLAGVAWTAATTLGGGVQATLAAGESWRVAFPYPGRFDVTITTRVGEVAVAAKHLPDLVVTGTVMLAAPKQD